MTELKSLIDWNAQIGDVFRFKMGEHLKSGDPVTITKVNPYWGTLGEDKFDMELVEDGLWECLARRTQPTEDVGKVNLPTEEKTGGPASYYDFPFFKFKTVNDLIDYLAKKQWGWRSYIFKDILKACFRFSVKEGTTEVYDAEKIVYYGARLLLSVSNIATVRKLLQKMLDDEQFKE